MPKVEIYTSPICGYCSRAKHLLTAKGVEFTEFNTFTNPDHRQEMLTRANGAHTVPQIFIGGQHIGGCDDLMSLERAGGLDEMLAG